MIANEVLYDIEQRLLACDTYRGIPQKGNTMYSPEVEQQIRVLLDQHKKDTQTIHELRRIIADLLSQ